MPSEQLEQVLIAGAGPIGLACGISAMRRGLSPLIIDSGSIAHSIYRYPVGMDFFTTPERLEIGGHPFACAGAKPTREEALKYYRGVARVENLRIRPWTTLKGAVLNGDSLRCAVNQRNEEFFLNAKQLVIATGYFDHPNMLDIPGESLPHVHHWFDEAHLTTGLDVVVIGGKNSAIDCALQCYRAGARVTLVYRGPQLKPTVKYWLRPDFDNRVAAGDIAVRYDTEVRAITSQTVTVQHLGKVPEILPAQRVYALTGYHPDFSLLRSLGITLDEEGRPALDPASLESNVAGIYVAGSAGAGEKTGEIFIENGRGDGEKIFGRRMANDPTFAAYAVRIRPAGE